MAIFRKKPKEREHPEQLTPWERFQREAAENQRAEQKRHHRWSGKRLRIGDKLPKLKTQRRRLLFKRVAILMSIFLVGAAVAGYFISPLSHVQAVTVRGTNQLTTAQVKTATKIDTGVALWSVIGHDQQTTKRARHAQPQIGKVTTQLVGYNRVRVTVKEIRIAGYLSTGQHYRRILENGLILKGTYSQPGGGSPIYANFKSGQRLEKMIAQYAKLSSAVKHNISEIKFAPNKSNPERVHLYMNDGNEVYATISTFASKMAYYPGISAKMKSKGVINLEVGAYSYPFKNQNN
ncbi:MULTISPECIES: cell division protein FtsQ/DivIB [Lactiplantibacillus]|jgi:cell division protein FtsQ|nr:MULTISPECIES: cell division protein FtsQ/DivIB [Lactiplantibacillus]MCH4130753.1 cell division protein FtsQ/DivIB [Lactiplantibacillus sp.]BBM23077.1 cell division initiation protein FtsQ [Lactiplantibacillus plantarum]ASG80980.1 cell division protein FtsQ [Lactiplantibacillus pentosus]AUI78371.1 cell division protein FtsQ [Lactiplantibacillus pentosus]AYG37721.1 FtsQ-type POTRA domain-containing protein [Lactiplantibacillus pentosus]